MKRKLWTLKFRTATLVLIPAAIGVNYLGKLFAQLLKLPLWLDSLGTCLAAAMAGAIVGGVNNLVYGVTVDPISTVYALTNIGIGIAVGVLAYFGFLDTIKKSLLSGLLVGLVCVAISTPLNMIFWGGTTGNIWGDGLFAVCMARNMPLWLSSALDEIIVDIPDKLVVLVMVYAIVKGIPKSVLNLYQSGEEITDLDKQ